MATTFTAVAAASSIEEFCQQINTLRSEYEESTRKVAQGEKEAEKLQQRLAQAEHEVQEVQNAIQKITAQKSSNEIELRYKDVEVLLGVKELQQLQILHEEKKAEYEAKVAMVEKRRSEVLSDLIQRSRDLQQRNRSFYLKKLETTMQQQVEDIRDLKSRIADKEALVKEVAANTEAVLLRTKDVEAKQMRTEALIKEIQQKAAVADTSSTKQLVELQEKEAAVQESINKIDAEFLHLQNEKNGLADQLNTFMRDSFEKLKKREATVHQQHRRIIMELRKINSEIAKAQEQLEVMTMMEQEGDNYQEGEFSDMVNAESAFQRISDSQQQEELVDDSILYENLMDVAPAKPPVEQMRKPAPPPRTTKLIPSKVTPAKRPASSAFQSVPSTQKPNTTPRRQTKHL